MVENPPSGSQADEYLPVRVSTLRSGVPLLFNVYVLYQEQHLHYRKPSESFEAKQIEKFLSKKIKKVYILANEEKAYLEYLESALDELKREDVSVEQKAEFAQSTMLSEAENVERNLDSEEGFNQTQNRINKVIDFVTAETGALRSMLASAGISTDNSAHSSNVASMSLALAGRIGLTDKKELMSMSLAALLHDIGIAKLGFESMVAMDKIPKDKLARWKTHPAEAVSMLAGKKYITPRVLKLIADHHEFGEGRGFPEKQRLEKLPISSQVFNLCDAFDHFCVDRSLKSADAFNLFVEANSENYNMLQLENLEKLML